MGVSCLKKTKTETKHNNIPLVNDKIIADFFLGSFLPLKKGDRAGRREGRMGRVKLEIALISLSIKTKL